MENILGFLVFVVIVVVSILNKIATERKAAREQLEEQDRPKTLDELPEATRRMILGDGEIIVARPRGGQYESEAPRARPAVERQPVPARRVTMETAPAAPQSVPARRVPVEMRPALEQTRRQQAPTVARSPLQQQDRPRPPRPQASGQQATRAARQRPEPQRARAPIARKPVAVKKAAPARPRKQGVAGLLHSKNELARAMLLREILGPPKALEDL